MQSILHLIVVLLALFALCVDAFSSTTSSKKSKSRSKKTTESLVVDERSEIILFELEYSLGMQEWKSLSTATIGFPTFTKSESVPARLESAKRNLELSEDDKTALNKNSWYRIRIKNANESLQTNPVVASARIV